MNICFLFGLGYWKLQGTFKISYCRGLCACGVTSKRLRNLVNYPKETENHKF